MKAHTFPGAKRATRRIVRAARAIRREWRDAALRALLNEPVRPAVTRHPAFTFIACASTFGEGGAA